LSLAVMAATIFPRPWRNIEERCANTNYDAGKDTGLRREEGNERSLYYPRRRRGCR
jgi:hypothetical protein